MIFSIYNHKSNLHYIYFVNLWMTTLSTFVFKTDNFTVVKSLIN